MISLSDHASHVGCTSAAAERGRIAAKRISAAMGDNFLIRRGQLNRMNRRCQAHLISS
jgi:hypothetical protein